MNSEICLQQSFLQLGALMSVRCTPQPYPAISMCLFNKALAGELGLPCEDTPQGSLAELYSGQRLFAGSLPLAQAYAGHQYGHFTMLGDGRALLLGELPQGSTLYDVALKGSGQTPFSRGGDGRAHLQAMLKEYVYSEALHFLGIKTTRSLAVLATNERVQREQELAGAVLCRLARSHLRIGSFCYVRALDNLALLQQLCDYTIRRHYPQLQDCGEDCAVLLLQSYALQLVDLLQDWMRVGFAHGVLNTDNMSLAAETLDLGPCAFLEQYAPGKSFSSIDRHNRYSYANQPAILQWNLARLAEALLPLCRDPEQALPQCERIVADFGARSSAALHEMHSAKLGFAADCEQSRLLAAQLFELMELQQLDFTNTFAGLSLLALEANRDSIPGSSATQAALALAAEAALRVWDAQRPELFSPAAYARLDVLQPWIARWLQALQQQPEPQLQQGMERMLAANPQSMLRSHRLVEALQLAEQGDASTLEQLLEMLQQPYRLQAVATQWQYPAALQQRVQTTYCGT